MFHNNCFTRWVAILSRVNHDESSWLISGGRQLDNIQAAFSLSHLLDKIWEQREVLCVLIPTHRVVHADVNISAMLTICATPLTTIKVRQSSNGPSAKAANNKIPVGIPLGLSEHFSQGIKKTENRTMNLSS